MTSSAFTSEMSFKTLATLCVLQSIYCPCLIYLWKACWKNHREVTPALKMEIWKTFVWKKSYSHMVCVLNPHVLCTSSSAIRRVMTCSKANTVTYRPGIVQHLRACKCLLGAFSSPFANFPSARLTVVVTEGWAEMDGSQVQVQTSITLLSS